MAELTDYLDISVRMAREQFRAMAVRRPVQTGRQVTFLLRSAAVARETATPRWRPISGPEVSRLAPRPGLRRLGRVRFRGVDSQVIQSRGGRSQVPVRLTRD